MLTLNFRNSHQEKTENWSRCKVPILMYHDLISSSGANGRIRNRYAVDISKFDEQMKYLSDSGYQACSLENIIKSSDYKSVAITFDDGYLSNYKRALPILNEYGFKASFFLVVEWIGRDNYLSWSQVGEMARMGMEIQSHTLSHPFLSGLSRREIFTELRDSKWAIEDQVQQEVKFLSLPGGRYNQVVLGLAREIGYKGVCTSTMGYGAFNIPNSVKKDFWGFRRFIIIRRMGFSTFRSIMEDKPFVFLRYGLKYCILNTLKKALGNSAYHRLWLQLFKP